jgi:hypothetical protein
MSWLPEGFEEPKSDSSYFKPQDGENKIRILSQPIIGWEDWNGSKPVRFRYSKKPKSSIDPAKEMRLFYTFIIWDYAVEKVKIYSVTQATIRKKLAALSKDDEWGAPYFYDIKIIRTGKDKLTDYQINPCPHKPVPEMIKQAFISKPCYLEALFDNADPYALGWPTYTKGMFSKDDLQASSEAPPSFSEDAPAIDRIDKKQQEDLNHVLMQCDPEYIKKIWVTLKSMQPSVERLQDIPIAIYERLLTAATKNRKEYQESLAKQDFPVEF